MKKIKKKWIWIIGIVIIIVLAFYFYSNETAFLYIKSCDELGNLLDNEYNKIDFSCNVNSDCIYASNLPCGACMNKNSDMIKYVLIDNEMSKRCSSASPACTARIKTPTHCECIFNNYVNKKYCAYV